MNKQDLTEKSIKYVENSEDNLLSYKTELYKNVPGIKIYEAPIFSFGAADNPEFQLLKNQNTIGNHFLMPEEWLPGSKTVISFFLPFTDAVKKGNSRDFSWPSEEWLYSRIEGQVLINKLSEYLKSELTNGGYNSVVPSLDKRFRAETNPTFTSNWSERHAAFICGLGTFGLSKGLITSKGISGRLGSIITELYLAPDERKYKDIYEYCSMCGACGKNCPVNAISIAEGKNHLVCSAFLDKTAEKFKPRYGCGKCQVKVPCENRIPKKAI